MPRLLKVTRSYSLDIDMIERLYRTADERDMKSSTLLNEIVRWYFAQLDKEADEHPARPTADLDSVQSEGPKPFRPLDPTAFGGAYRPPGELD